MPFGEYGYLPSTSLPGDLFGDGDRVVLEAAGDDVPAFSLEADSPPSIAIDLEAGEESDDTLRLVDGEDLVVSWSPAVPGTRVRLDILSNNRGHGQPVERDDPVRGGRQRRAGGAARDRRGLPGQAVRPHLRRSGLSAVHA